MSKSCAVTGCGATHEDFGTFLFRFPEARDARHRWIEKLGKSFDWSVPVSESWICWSHFDERDLVRKETEFQRRPDAMPTKLLGTELNARDSDHDFCRFCATVLYDKTGENSLREMNGSVDSRNLLNFLLPNGIEERLSSWACDECLLQVKLVVRFMRNCEKASRALESIASLRSKDRTEIKPKHEVKAEMDEFGEIPIGSVQPEVKMEVSSIGGFSDRDSDSFSDEDDDLPLARRLEKETTVKKELHCAHCSFSCAKPIQLNSHMKKHRALLATAVVPREVGPLKCALCDFSCNKPNQLASHKKKHKRELQDEAEPENTDCTSETKPTELTTSSEDPVQLQCPQCPYACERPIQMASHKKKHTSKKVRKEAADVPIKKVNDMYECEFCDFQCKFRRQMAGHRASHSNMIKTSKPSGKERDHMCSICGKILSTRGSFFVHMKYHNDQRDYSCHHCDKKFYSKRDVAMHVESFHEKKKFECEICGIKCTWKNALYKHMRKHDASSFKHECSYCGKKFIAANELRLHVWRHTGQQLSCDICGAGYRFNFLLTQHKIREHGMQIDGVKLYKRFQKGKSASSGAGPRKRVEQIDPSKCIPATTVHQPIADQQHPLEEQSSNSSYTPEVVAGHHLTQHHPGQPLGTVIPNLPFHSLGPLGGQPMPSVQVGSFDQVGNY